jgi:hypothetical protein
MTDLLDTETGERVPSGATITVPVAIHAKLIGDNERLRRELAEARGALQELRIRLHAAGRRPEECYEMSVIDTALAADQPSAAVVHRTGCHALYTIPRHCTCGADGTPPNQVYGGFVGSNYTNAMNAVSPGSGRLGECPECFGRGKRNLSDGSWMRCDYCNGKGTTADKSSETLERK